MALNMLTKSTVRRKVESCLADCKATRLSKVAALFCVLLMTPAAYAADITLSDTCSLANAIRSANGDTQVAPANQCATGDSDETDTIFIVADVEITEALPAIASDLRIASADKSLSPPDTDSQSSTEYNFSLLTINSGAVRIENLSLSGVDDSALKIVKTGDDELEVLFNLGSIGHNNAATHGGAIYIAGGAEVTIHSTRIGDNKAPNGDGGAIYVDDSTLTIKWSNLHDNSAASDGGAIYFANDSDEDHSLTILGSRLARNSATDRDSSTNTDENGGAIYIDNGVQTDEAISTLEDNSITANTARSGGSIYLANGKLIIDNSTIDVSVASAEGGGVYVAGGNLTVRHATIVRNRAATGSGIGIFSDDDENTDDPTVYVYNSIIAQNTDTDGENSVCLEDLLTGSEGNVFEDVGCAVAQSVAAPVGIELVAFGGPNLPRSVVSRFYRLLDGSPAIDNGVATEGQMLSNDQTGHSRPEGQGYDSGSFEFDFEEIWPTYSLPTADNQSSDTTTAVDLRTHTCAAVDKRDNGIQLRATHGLESGVQCQEINAGGIGIQSVIDAGFTHAVDIWGYVEQGVQVCFNGAGSILFLDAMTAPRTVISIGSFNIDGNTCTTIWRPGSLVLLATQADHSALPAATAQPLPLPSPTPAPQCLATTTAAVNLRDTPSGTRIGGAFANETLHVLGQSENWYQVNRLGTVGWISSAYATLSGECNFNAA